MPAYTQHGHPIPQSEWMEAIVPPKKIQCGGVPVCEECKGDANEWHVNYAANLQGAARPYEGQLYRVFRALKQSGLNDCQVMNAISELLSEGILDA